MRFARTRTSMHGDGQNHVHSDSNEKQVGSRMVHGTPDALPAKFPGEVSPRAI
jgi:hypothetical protein